MGVTPVFPMAKYYSSLIFRRHSFRDVFISGVQIVGPLRGSIRGIVGYVETTVGNFDLLIDAERLRSMSSPEASVHKLHRH